MPSQRRRHALNWSAIMRVANARNHSRVIMNSTGMSESDTADGSRSNALSSDVSKANTEQRSLVPTILLHIFELPIQGGLRRSLHARPLIALHSPWSLVCLQCTFANTTKQKSTYTHLGMLRSCFEQSQMLHRRNICTALYGAAPRL